MAGLMANLMFTNCNWNFKILAKHTFTEQTIQHTLNKLVIKSLLQLVVSYLDGLSSPQAVACGTWVSHCCYFARFCPPSLSSSPCMNRQLLLFFFLIIVYIKASVRSHIYLYIYIFVFILISSIIHVQLLLYNVFSPFPPIWLCVLSSVVYLCLLFDYLCCSLPVAHGTNKLN